MQNFSWIIRPILVNIKITHLHKIHLHRLHCNGFWGKRKFWKVSTKSIDFLLFDRDRHSHHRDRGDILHWKWDFFFSSCVGTFSRRLSLWLLYVTGTNHSSNQLSNRLFTSMNKKTEDFAKISPFSSDSYYTLFFGLAFQHIFFNTNLFSDWRRVISSWFCLILASFMLGIDCE